MKKKLIIILLIMITIITGCSNKKEEVQKKASDKVNIITTDITNITEKDIKDSYIYIRDNYKNYKDDKVYEKLIYNVEYLKLLGKYSKDNKLITLATKVETYLNKPNKKNKEEVAILLNNIDGEEDKIINEIYTNYLTLNTVKRIIEEQTLIVEGDINDKNLVTKDYINKAVTYLSNHLQKPFKNDEVLEKTIYYSLFLSKLGNKDNDITILSTYILEYINTLDTEYQEKAITLIATINKNQNKYVDTYYNEIESNK